MALADVPLPRRRPPRTRRRPPPPLQLPLRRCGRPVSGSASLRNLIDAVWIAAVALRPSPCRSAVRAATPRRLVASLVSLLLGIVVPILCWAAFGATPGKALLGLRVIGGERRRGLGIVLAFLRLCGVMVSAVLFGLGFVMVAFTRDKRGLHDHLAGTAVIRR